MSYASLHPAVDGPDDPGSLHDDREAQEREERPSHTAALSPGAPTDAVLVQRAAEGDREAIAVIWSRYHRMVKSVVISTLGPDQEVDDLVQEVFLGLFRTVDQVRDGTALPAILSRIAVRRVGMTIRRRRIRSLMKLLPWTQLPDIVEQPPDLDSRLAVKALYRVLERVKERPRLAFLLHHVHGMNLAEVADTLELSPTATKRAIAAGRKRVLQLARSDARLKQFLPNEGRLQP